jgi:hypothetical protein
MEMKKRFFYAGVIIILILYYFLVTPMVGRELYFKPLKRVKAETLVSEGLSGEFVGLETAHYSGFVNSGLKSSFFAEKRHFAAFNDSKMILVDKDSFIREIMESSGVPAGRFESRGYPLVSGGRILVLDSINNTLEERDLTGNLLWRRNVASLLTSLSAGPDWVLAGLIDGRCLVIDKEGKDHFWYQPGGSRIEAIYGSALSHQGNTMAVLSGLDPQRVIILDQRESGFRPLDHLEVEENYRRSVPFYFAEDDKRVYWQGFDKIRFYEFITRRFGSIPIPAGSVVNDLFQEAEEGLLFLVADRNGQTTLVVRNDKDQVIFSGLYLSGFSRIKLLEKFLFLVKDDDILLIQRVEG